MDLYLSKTFDTVGGAPIRTEFISEHVCLNPKYLSGVTITNPNTKILMDSGAFQDRDGKHRLSFDDALKRQLDGEAKVGVQMHRVVAYDKIGCDFTTLAANRFLVSQRPILAPRQLVLMVQGPTLRDYLYCLHETLRMAQPHDCIGFGGIANAGRSTEVREKLYDTLKIGLPLMIGEGFTDMHLFGVGSLTVLKRCHEIIDLLGAFGVPKELLGLSCDTSAFEMRSAMGYELDLAAQKWLQVHKGKQRGVDYDVHTLTTTNMTRGVTLVGRL